MIYLGSREKQVFDALGFKLFPWSHLGELFYWKESIPEKLLIYSSLSNPCNTNYLVGIHKIVVYFAPSPQASSVTAVRSSESYFAPFITKSVVITGHSSHLRAIKQFFVVVLQVSCASHLTVWDIPFQGISYKGTQAGKDWLDSFAPPGRITRERDNCAEKLHSY